MSYNLRQHILGENSMPSRNSIRTTLRWSCPECNASGTVTYDLPGDHMAITARCANEHSRATARCSGKSPLALGPDDALRGPVA